MLSDIDAYTTTATKTSEARYRFGRTFPPNNLEDQLRVVSEIIDYLRSGRQKIGRFALVRHGDWKEFINSTSVSGRLPKEMVEFRAIQQCIELESRLAKLLSRWDRQAHTIGLPESADFDRPAVQLPEMARAIRKSLAWATDVWEPICSDLENLGLNIDGLQFADDPSLSATPEVARRQKLLDSLIPPVVTARLNAATREHLSEIHAHLQSSLEEHAENVGSSNVTRALVDAMKDVDPDGYRGALAELRRLWSLRPDFKRRSALLARLRDAAPTWAQAISQRKGVHGDPELPGDPDPAWLLRQLDQELERRRNAPLQELQERLEKLSSDIRRATETVVEKRAWASQVRRTSRREKQALFGWKDIVNKIPKRSTVPGKLAKLKKAAQQAMAECRDAVPVWIMPVNELVENFDLGTTRFDVVIIDEASQTDVSGLLLYYIADKVLVVGDHEQVSPAAVGQKDAVVQGLIDEHLTGIPNAILYDGRTSIYDLARQSSGEIICLLEHFRCLPEIIQFSNDLCYSGRIKPLRDTSSVSLNPTVVSYRVEGAQTGYQVNEPEAEAVASLIAACVESDAYDGKSFGVVSLVGDRQALEIERILRESLDPERYAEHQIVCGNPAQFQGDERDVVFLSMVDVADDGPLRMRNQPLFRQRFNVAASRAKDQLWVVHSLDPKRDVKPGDLRRRLIEHALDPASVVRKLDRLGHQTESEFERRVLGHLVRAGYKVVPQWPVGYYRIDLVAVGGGKRLAIECDGDRYHTMDDLENDVARQLTLERLGWTFVRIRGSHFFRDPDGAMEPVFASLEALGITPEDTQVGEEHTVAPALLDAVVTCPPIVGPV